MGSAVKGAQEEAGNWASRIPVHLVFVSVQGSDTPGFHHCEQCEAPTEAGPNRCRLRWPQRETCRRGGLLC